MTSRPESTHQSRQAWTRRSLLGLGLAGSAVVLSGCSVGSDDPEVEPTPEPSPTPEVTQAPPVPTQAPISSPVAGYLDPQRWAGRSLVVTSPALGDTLEAIQEAFLDAFATATGASVRHQELGRDGIEGLVSQVEANEVVWDVALIPTEEVLSIAQQSMLTAIDYNVVDRTAL